MIDADRPERFEPGQELFQAIGCGRVSCAKLDWQPAAASLSAISPGHGFPWRYISVGEQVDDIELFDPIGFVDAAV
ncbi:MAG: hypothetical protein U0996_23965 [Planctomycetaceae bacterium]